MDLEKGTWVRFEVEGYQCALAASNVIEVVKCRPLTPVPLTSSQVLGVFLYRGRVVPVVDITGALKNTRKLLDKCDQRFMVTCLHGRWMAFVIDRVVQIAALGGGINQGVEPGDQDLFGAVSYGYVKNGTDAVFLLNLENIINIFFNHMPLRGGNRGQKESTDC